MTTTSQSPNPPSRNFFSSKPFRILAATVVLLCGGLFVFKLLKDNTTLSFSFVLDGKPLPVGTAAAVQVDGRPFISGLTITPGPHQLTADLQIAEPFVRRVWVFFGNKNLGVLALESSKGSLLVSVNPSPAGVILRRGTETMGKGDAPLPVEKLPLGNYELEIKRGEYKETRPVKIEGRQRTDVKIDLNLGGVDLTSTPADAEFELSGNGRHWQGKLPTKIEDIPGGNYSLVVRRKGWELNKDISISRGSVTTNKTEFQYGSIEVTSDPAGLLVSTNGVEIDKTPLTLHEVKPGQYTLAVSDGENDLLANVSVGPKEAVKHAFVFHYGTVQLSSTPTGATVIRKGKEIGKTPLTLNHIPAGETRIELRLQGYESTNISIQAVEGITTNLSAKLISERYLQAMKQARESLAAGKFEESRKFVAVALESEPNDPAAMELQDKVSKAVAIAAEARKEAERVAEAVRKAAEQKEIVAIIEKAINAVGGRDAINKFRSIKTVSQVSGKSKGSDFAMRTTIYVQLPDTIRLDQVINNSPKKLGPLTLTVNNGRPVQSTYCITPNGSWEIVPGILGVPMQTSSVGKILQNCLLTSLYLAECTTLIPLLRPDYTLEKLPESLAASFNAVAIKVHKSGQNDVTLYFDKDSGFLVGLETDRLDMHGNLVHDAERYSDYRNYSGLMHQTTTRYRQDANTFSTEIVESFEPFIQNYGNVFREPPRQR